MFEITMDERKYIDYSEFLFKCMLVNRSKREKFRIRLYSDPEYICEFRQLFKKYFYQVVLYQERKPGIYTEFDDHMRRVIILEFFKRIIAAYLHKSRE